MATTKKLNTGVKTTISNKGTVTVESPYMDDLMFDEPTLDSIYSKEINNQLNKLFS